MRNFIPPAMPSVSVEADIVAIFRQAREVAASLQPRQIVVITPERTLEIKICRPPGTATLGMTRPIQKIVPFKAPVNITMIGYTETKFFNQNPSDCIPFFGYLMGMGYMGHNVIIFEGHESALAAGLKGADLLLIDEGMLSFLPSNWKEIAQQEMRTPRILTLNRNGKMETQTLHPIDVPPHDFETFLQNAHKLAKEGKMNEAIASYNKALDFNPTSEQAYYNRGFVYMQQGNLEKAVEDFTKALNIKPTLFEALFQRGVAYAKQDNFQGAFSDFNQALKLNRQSSQAYLQRGKILAQKRKYEAAIIDFSTSIQLKPTLEALLERARAYEANQQISDAIADYRLYLKVGSGKNLEKYAEIKAHLQDLTNQEPSTSV